MKHILSLLILVSVSLTTFAQNHVRGTVVDASGDPIIGASVVVVGTTTGAVTDVDGKFDISNVASQGQLKASFVGYSTVQVPYNVAKAVKITLRQDDKSLDEIVVVGFGTQKKANLTGAVASVNNKLLDNRPLTNLSSGLAGLLPGVSVLQSSGQPGQDVGTVNIRGIGTFNESAPLVIIDGFEGSMNDVNPNDVANISVLKDAASASIYGSKASNGVILITTKRGQTGKPTVTYQGLVGVTKATAYPEFMESAEIAEKWNLANESVGVADQYTAAEIQKFRDGSDPDNYANTDWQGLLYKSSIQTSHNVTLQGGTENAKYLASLGYLYQDGIIKNYNKNQYSARINVDINPVKNLETSFSLSYMRQDVNEPLPSYNQDASYSSSYGSTGGAYDIIRQINVISPMIPNVYTSGDNAGKYGRISDGNPIAWVESGANSKVFKSNLNAIASAKYYILPCFSVKLALNHNRNETETAKHFISAKYYNGTQGTTYVSQAYSNYERTSLDVLPEFKKSFGGHNVDVLAGYHAELYKYRYTYAYRTGMANDIVSELNAGSSSTAKAEGYTRELAMLSWFGRIAYDYMGRYLFEANARYDGSSRFAEGHRWGFFPSFSAGWRFSDESFWESLRGTVSNAKLRASWGKLGNQDINGTYYPTISTMSLGYGNVFAGTYVNGVKSLYANNENLTWETTTSWGIGLDFDIWKFDVNLDWYSKETEGILMTSPTPAVYALSNYYDNIGKVRNRGFEFNINYNDKFGEVTFGAGINGCYNNNTVLDLGVDASGAAREYISADVDQSTVRNVVGLPMNQYYGLMVDGFIGKDEVSKYQEMYSGYINSTLRAGDLKYVDLNGDGKITNDDRTYLGSIDPKWTFGFHFNVGWKGIDFVAFFQGAANVKRYMGDAIGGLGNTDTKPNVLWRDSYTFVGEGAEYPNIGIPGQNYYGNGGQNSFWIQNSSYVRMKDLQLGYTLPHSLTQKWGISNVRIYYSGQNLFTLSGMIKGFDPEAPSGRGNGYPQTAINSIGLNVTF